jgi:hypothetical protein
MKLYHEIRCRALTERHDSGYYMLRVCARAFADAQWEDLGKHDAVHLKTAKKFGNHPRMDDICLDSEAPGATFYVRAEGNRFGVEMSWPGGTIHFIRFDEVEE